MTTKVSLYSLAAASILIGQNASATLVTLDFEDYTPGTLVGQDGWSAGTVGTGNGLGGGVNVSQVYDGAAGVNAARRINNPTVPRPNGTYLDYTVTSDIQAFQFDAYNDNGNNTTLRVLLGSATNSATTTSPWLGWNGNNLEIRGNTGGSLTSVAFFGAGAGLNARNNWYTLRLEMDVVNQTASAFYRNLTDGETTFSPVAGLQNITIDANNVANWNSVFLRLDGSALTGSRQIDNISFEGVVVPEPSSLLLLSLGGLFVTRRRR